MRSSVTRQALMELLLCVQVWEQGVCVPCLSGMGSVPQSGNKCFVRLLLLVPSTRRELSMCVRNDQTSTHQGAGTDDWNLGGMRG